MSTYYYFRFRDEALLAAVCRLKLHHSPLVPMSLWTSRKKKPERLEMGKRSQRVWKCKNSNLYFDFLSLLCPSSKYFSIIPCQLDSEASDGHTMMLLRLSPELPFVLCVFVCLFFYVISSHSSSLLYIKAQKVWQNCSWETTLQRQRKSRNLKGPLGYFGGDGGHHCTVE